MTGILTGYEKESVAEVGAVLDDSPATADEVYLRTMGQSERAIAAVAAKRAGEGGGGGGGVLSLASVNLTNAQVLALPTTGVNVVPAPGANKLLFLFGAFMYLKWTADYTNIDSNCDLALGYGTRASSSGRGTGLLGSNDVSGLLAFGEDGTAFLPGLGQVPALSTSVLGYGGLDDPPNLVNQPLTLLASNGGAGDFTGGDPANTLQVTVYYNTLTLL